MKFVIRVPLDGHRVQKWYNCLISTNIFLLGMCGILGSICIVLGVRLPSLEIAMLAFLATMFGIGADVAILAWLVTSENSPIQIKCRGDEE